MRELNFAFSVRAMTRMSEEVVMKCSFHTLAMSCEAQVHLDEGPYRRRMVAKDRFEMHANLTVAR